MKKILLLLLLTISAKAFCQQHWEDNFWREKAKERYSRTFTMAGLYTAYYSNGQIKWQGKCLENGNPDSVWVYYNPDGKKLWQGEYNGKYYEFKDIYDPRLPRGRYSDTSLIGNYKNGVKDGEWLIYDAKGTFIIKKGHFRNGEPTGLWQEFTEEPVVTQLLKTAEYDYTTQTRTLYKRDSIDGSTHIDSLRYADEYGIEIETGKISVTSKSYLNYGFIGTAQLLDFSSLNNYFFQTNYSMLNSQLTSIGVDFAGTTSHFYWDYNLFWTPAISAQLNDSIRLRLSGYNTAISFGYDFIKSHKVDFGPTMGFGFQQLKLKILKLQNPNFVAYAFNEGDYRVYRKSSPTLNANLNLRVNAGAFSFGISGGYVLDCSRPKWRYNGRFLNDSPYTSVSGFTILASIGFHMPLE